MKPHPDSTEPSPSNDLGNPNDDGCVLGTAGRDEDPNATTDWDRHSDSTGTEQTPEDAHGMPGYPRDTPTEQTRPSERSQAGNPDAPVESPTQDDDRIV